MPGDALLSTDCYRIQQKYHSDYKEGNHTLQGVEKERFFLDNDRGSIFNEKTFKWDFRFFQKIEEQL